MLRSEEGYSNGLTGSHLGRNKEHVRGAFSSWTRVTNGIPQGLVLVPLRFLIHVNDMLNEINSDLNMFADDTKFITEVCSNRNCEYCKETETRWPLKCDLGKCSHEDGERA